MNVASVLWQYRDYRECIAIKKVIVINETAIETTGSDLRTISSAWEKNWSSVFAQTVATLAQIGSSSLFRSQNHFMQLSGDSNVSAFFGSGNFRKFFWKKHLQNLGLNPEPVILYKGTNTIVFLLIFKFGLEPSIFIL